MISNHSYPEEKIDKFGILTLVLSRGLTQLPLAMAGILLVDIALSFNVEVGMAGQINTASGLFSIFFGLIMGVLSIKYKHKSLLLTGILLFVLVAVSSFFSSSLPILIGVFSFVGIGNALVIPMINTLIGELVAPDKHTSVIGYTVGGMSFIYFLGVLSAGFLSYLGWRLPIVLVIAPIGIITSIMCRTCIPSQDIGPDSQTSMKDLFKGYMNVLRNRSAIGCLICTVLSFSVWYFYPIYGASFFRQVYNIDPGMISALVIFITVAFIIGSISAGRLVNLADEKTILAICTGMVGALTLIVFRIPSFWIAYFLSLLVGFSAGAMITVSSSYALSQIPEYKGTMMSIHSASDSFGFMISAGLGGTLLLLYDYEMSSTTLGLLGIIGAVILLTLTRKT
jgi:predicted MFS family arabinose efflux permease